MAYGLSPQTLHLYDQSVLARSLKSMSRGGKGDKYNPDSAKINHFDELPWFSCGLDATSSLRLSPTHPNSINRGKDQHKLLRKEVSEDHQRLSP